MAKKSALAITVGGSSGSSSTRVALSRWVVALLGVVFLVLLALASITVYTLIDPQAGRSRGDNLSYRNSSGTREQEQEKLIKLGEERLLELQRENAARKKDVEDLETRVLELSGSIKSLQQLAKEIEQRLPGGAAPAAQPPPGGGSAQPSKTPGTGGAFDARQGRAYTTQFNQVLQELDGINKSITNGRHSIATLDIQVQSYRATLSQQKTFLETESTRLTELNKERDANGAPNVLPANCVLTSPFGVRWSPFVSGVKQMHYGIDIGCFEGTPVAATKAGIVTYVGTDGGYGNRVEVTHPGGWMTLYAHNNRILAKVGQTVQKGDIIALSGNTGASTGPHIHYEVHEKGIPVDPLKYVSGLKPAFQGT